jgi:hypothetical protein
VRKRSSDCPLPIVFAFSFKFCRKCKIFVDYCRKGTGEEILKLLQSNINSCGCYDLLLSGARNFPIFPYKVNCFELVSREIRIVASIMKRLQTFQTKFRKFLVFVFAKIRKSGFEVLLAASLYLTGSCRQR